MSLDWRVLAFTLAVSLATTLLFGLAPALSGSRVNLVDSLKQGGRSGTAGKSGKRLRNILVVTEMALSLMLLVGASLLVQSIQRLEHQNLGIREDHLLKGSFYLPPVRYPDPNSITRFCDNFAARIRALPGVIDASVTTTYPPTNGWIQMYAHRRAKFRHAHPGHPHSPIRRSRQKFPRNVRHPATPRPRFRLQRYCHQPAGSPDQPGTPTPLFPDARSHRRKNSHRSAAIPECPARPKHNRRLRRHHHRHRRRFQKRRPHRPARAANHRPLFPASAGKLRLQERRNPYRLHSSRAGSRNSKPDEPNRSRSPTSRSSNHRGKRRATNRRPAFHRHVARFLRRRGSRAGNRRHLWSDFIRGHAAHARTSRKNGSGAQAAQISIGKW